MSGRALVLRGDARELPLPDASVDLICTSPPFYALRSYTDGGEHYPGQIGSEATPAEYIAALIDCTREWMRVLKPSGSMLIDLGDKYSDRGHGPNRGAGTGRGPQATYLIQTRGPREKSLLLLPERYRIACVDQLGLIVRAVVVWHKVNGLPESAKDRVRRSHEDWVHLTKQPQYYSAVDEIREPHARIWGGSPNGGHTYGTMKAAGEKDANLPTALPNPLGKLPGSVWEIPTEPLRVPDHIGIAHFAAFPLAFPLRIIVGWSPPGICVECSDGRQPVAHRIRQTYHGYRRYRSGAEQRADGAAERGWAMDEKWSTAATVVGYACSCTPYTDHPRTGERHRHSGPSGNHRVAAVSERPSDLDHGTLVGTWREYHLDGWTPPPTRPAVVLDPFGGTGTTALAARALGRIGITVDRSGDYCRLAQWRTTDPGELAKAMRVQKPPTQLDGQDPLFGLAEVR